MLCLSLSGIGQSSLDIEKLDFLQQTVGDVNGDGKVAIDDVTAPIDYLTSSGSGNMAADVNGDSKVAIDDVTALIDFLLQ